jgi:hypothetical protein
MDGWDQARPNSSTVTSMSLPRYGRSRPIR